MADIDWTGWQHDGHKLHCGVSLYFPTNPQALDRRGRAQLDGTVECPEDSVCHQHFATNREEYRCLLQDEIRALSFWDFIDAMEPQADLPKDWSSPFPIEIEWQERGEDGIVWRPVVA